MTLAGLSAGVYLEQALRDWTASRIEATLLGKARLVRDTVALLSPTQDIATVDPIANRLGESAGARVTIVASDGRVIGDSDVDREQIATVDNHGQRPEIVVASAEGTGSARRYSTTLGTYMLYVAVRLHPSGGVARVSMPLRDVDEAVLKLRMILWLAAGVGLFAAILMSGMASSLFSRPLVKLAATTHAYTDDRERRSAQTDEVSGISGSFSSIVSDLNTAVDKLAAERDHLGTILEGISDGVIAVDRGLRITRHNGAASVLLGLARGPTGQALIEEIRSPALLKLTKAALTEGQAHSSELQLHPNVICKVQVVPLRTTGGAVIVFHDVTEVQRLEAIRQDFVANVSHELRTPVTVIRANTETLLGGALADEVAAPRFVEAIHRNSERLSQIIADLLDLARMEAGRQDLNTGPVAATEFLSELRIALKSHWLAKNQKVALRTEGSLYLLADPRALQQVGINLLENAIAYTPAGGSIVLTAQTVVPNRVRIEVVDNGPGIAAVHRQRVFERFYRIDPGRSRDVAGTGLGLSIVKHLVAAQGGDVGVQPSPSGGATFWFTLPLVHAADD